MAIEDTIKSIIADELGLDSSEITENASFIDDLGADSLDIMQLIMEIEEEFNIEISDEEASELVTVDKVIEYVKKQQ